MTTTIVVDRGVIEIDISCVTHGGGGGNSATGEVETVVVKNSGFEGQLAQFTDPLPDSYAVWLNGQSYPQHHFPEMDNKTLNMGFDMTADIIIEVQSWVFVPTS
jgi:hypothetical protein